MEYLQQLDQELFLYLNNLGNPSWDWFWVFITHKWASLPLYALVTWLMYKKIGIKKAFISVVLIGVMIMVTYGFAHLVKYGVMRPRPCNMDFSARFLIEDCGTYGFFSAHSSSAMALAVFVGLILKPFYKQATFWLVIWALVMSYSRIYVGKHYPGDVVVGLVIGLVIGWLFYIIQQKVARKFGS